MPASGRSPDPAKALRFDDMKITYSTTLVLEALARGYHYGFDIMDATNLPERHRLSHPSPARTGGHGDLGVGEPRASRNPSSDRRDATTR